MNYHDPWNPCNTGDFIHMIDLHPTHPYPELPQPITPIYPQELQPSYQPNDEVTVVEEFDKDGNMIKRTTKYNKQADYIYNIINLDGDSENNALI